ncbi:uncharacterized protein EV420DRAFT_15892 [Desarmillaria tabescens]|uniref:Uncharacterized protein n=1 Tax=Armillaria tabescens TaxID=1929756 RepID=A0AA39TXF6_ARMTA|nr:uncharacterized protein EV420DRAFT_15892 [Desarmillaria tabescens]KAK0469228.1 hypothetical protein EV420DRAFT_15892 [Desarmillaria tabescens]
MYIPPQGIYFRLLGRVSQCVLFARNGPEPLVWQYKGPEYEDQLFTLIHGTGSHAGLYAIKSKCTGKVLFSRGSPPPRVGQIEGDGAHPDNWFDLEEGSGKYAGGFRILCSSTGLVLYSRTNAEPLFGNHPKADVAADQYFSFIFEDMIVKSVDYKLELGKILNVTPHVLANQTLRNNSDREQEMAFDFSENVTQTSLFEYTTGFTVSVGTEFSVGIPLVAEGKISVSTTLNNEWRFGIQNTFSKTYTAHFPVKAGPQQTVHAVSTVQQGTLDVPYTMHLASKSAGVKVEMEGVWRGVSTWELHHDISVV